MRAAGVEELDRGDPAEVALENALRKAQRRVPARSAASWCWAATRVVALDGVIYGKPGDEAAARETLRALSGATHEVVSGVALVRTGRWAAAAGDRQRAYRGHLPRARRDADWTGTWPRASGAGGPAATRSRARGRRWCAAWRGSYENVVGLPLATLLDIYPELLSR